MSLSVNRPLQVALFNIFNQAFGIGALEEEEADDDVYTRDDMSKYDFVMGGSERDQLHGWTAPQHRGKGAFILVRMRKRHRFGMDT